MPGRTHLLELQAALKGGRSLLLDQAFDLLFARIVLAIGDAIEHARILGSLLHLFELQFLLRANHRRLFGWQVLHQLVDLVPNHHLVVVPTGAATVFNLRLVAGRSCEQAERHQQP